MIINNINIHNIKDSGIGGNIKCNIYTLCNKH